MLERKECIGNLTFTANIKQNVCEFKDFTWAIIVLDHEIWARMMFWLSLVQFFTISTE